MAEETEKNVVLSVLTPPGQDRDGGGVHIDSGDVKEPIDITRVCERVRAVTEQADYFTPFAMVGGTPIGNGKPGEITFCVGGKEALRIDGDGRFWKEGVLLGEDKDVIVVLRAFLGYVAGGMNRRYW